MTPLVGLVMGRSSPGRVAVAMKLALLTCALFALGSAKKEPETAKGLKAQLNNVYKNLFDKIPGASEMKKMLGQCNGDCKSRFSQQVKMTLFGSDLH